MTGHTRAASPVPGLNVDDRQGARILTLDRPAARNAFDDALYEAMRAALDEAAASSEVKVCLVTGAGSVFSAGQDLTEIGRRRSRAEVAERGFVPFVAALRAFDKPLIAAVNGAAVGIGVTMLLHCDLVLAAATARFRTPFVALGIAPEAASSVLLPARVGPQMAADMLFTSRWIEADEALARGLVWRVCPAEHLLDDALAVAGEIAAAPVDALVATKRLLLAAREDAVAAAMAREVDELGGLLRRCRE
jgi:enoyl-CoA hydratase/carnithine racemase